MTTKNNLAGMVMPDMLTPQQLLTIQNAIKDDPFRECLACGSSNFRSIMRFKFVPALLSPIGTDMELQYAGWECCTCGHIRGEEVKKT